MLTGVVEGSQCVTGRSRWPHCWRQDWYLHPHVQDRGAQTTSYRVTPTLDQSRSLRRGFWYLYASSHVMPFPKDTLSHCSCIQKTLATCTATCVHVHVYFTVPLLLYMYVNTTHFTTVTHSQTHVHMHMYILCTYTHAHTLMLTHMHKLCIHMYMYVFVTLYA